jgi:exodeoxyribonuclease VII small subunit
MKKITELSFEEAFVELEETVTRLERGDLSLEESIALFERGRTLATHCGQQLDVAELKVRQLLPETEGDSVPFDLEQG